MKNPDVEICNLIECRMNETIQEINKTYSIFESDKFHRELRIWIGYSIRFVVTSHRNDLI
jgi:hypothetical protein